MHITNVKPKTKTQNQSTKKKLCTSVEFKTAYYSIDMTSEYTLHEYGIDTQTNENNVHRYKIQSKINWTYIGTIHCPNKGETGVLVLTNAV